MKKPKPLLDDADIAEVFERPVRRYKRYAEYRDSGIEWLGQVPEHWEVRRMADLAKVTSGGTPSKDNAAFWNGDIPWVSPKDMKVRDISDAIDHVSASAVANTGLKLLQPPQVLIVVRGMILAHTFPTAKTTVPVTINQDMKALQLVPGVDPDYFVSLLEGIGDIVLMLIDEAGHGTKVLRTDLWRQMRLQLPPLPEQRAIFSFLQRETAKLDALISKKERLIELLQEKRSALITRAVTKGLDPNVPMKDSGVEWLGEIPAHWKAGVLGRWWEVIDCKHRTVSFSDDGVPVVSIGEVKGLEVDLQSAKRTSHAEYAAMIEGGRKPRVGDVIYSRNATVGAAAFVATPEPFCLGQDVSLIRSDAQDQWFLVFLLRSPAVLEQLGSVKVGSTFDRVNVARIKKFLVTLPPIEEQHAIGAFCRTIDDRMGRLATRVAEAIEHLKELRSALITSAVTGKIDVRQEPS